jgi:hypothetical protein
MESFLHGVGVNPYFRLTFAGEIAKKSHELPGTILYCPALSLSLLGRVQALKNIWNDRSECSIFVLE